MQPRSVFLRPRFQQCSLAALALFGAACGDDPNGTVSDSLGASSSGGADDDGATAATGESSAGTGTTGVADSSGGSSGAGESSSGGGEASSGGGETSSGGGETSSGGGEASTGGGASSGGGAQCGDGVLDPGEVCDGASLDGETCISQGQGAGTLACLDDCSGFDLSGCGAPIACGNDLIEGMEVCDGTDLALEDCVSQGFNGGVLGCAVDCGAFDTSGCSSGVGFCCTAHGNTGCDDAVCQGSVCALDSYCCQNQWDNICATEATDDPNCAAACTTVCGDDVAEASEVCDGTDLAGQDCTTQGFTAGVLTCALDCTGFDTSGCTGGASCCAAHDTPGCSDGLCEGSVCAFDPFCCDTQWDAACATEAQSDANCAGACGVVACGDGVIGGAEVCDGTALAGQDCVSQGFTGGTLACAGDCSGFDTSGCTDVPSDCCAAHAGVGCTDAACEASVCALDAFCCATSWDAQCAGEAAGDPACVAGCTAGGTCGDDLIDGGETCDGTDLAGESCTTLGFTGGTLGCLGDCSDFDTSNCSNGPSDCCSAHAGTGCSDAGCEASVCGLDPFCCSTSWDGQCAGEAEQDPACTGGCGIACGDNVISGAEVCDGTDLGGQSCASQGFVGGALACNGSCTAFDTSACIGVAACSDQSIGSALGTPVATGNTAGDDNDLDPTCGAGNANDHVVTFTAPAAGSYTISTNGSTYDTVMAVFSDCATQIACDDDSGVGTQSLLVLNLAAGQTILIAVDGFNGATGNWNLNITSP